MKFYIRRQRWCDFIKHCELLCNTATHSVCIFVNLVDEMVSLKKVCVYFYSFLEALNASKRDFYQLLLDKMRTMKERGKRISPLQKNFL